MPILELCAGYGGLGLAVEALTGDKVAYVAENAEAASLVLAEHFPDAPNIGDITTYEFTRLTGLVDTITAGFSCQDISNAGPRKGISGERSRVWKDVARAVRDIQPRLIFLENVGAIRHRNRGLDVVLADLAALGYDAWWVCIRASDVGAPHHRERWFCIARPQDSHGTAGPERLGPASGQAEEGGHGPTLDDEVSFLLPYAYSGGRDRRAGDEPEAEGRDEPSDGDYSPAEWWGDYLPTIRRWEELTGHPAPQPTETGPRGGRRLAAPFAEWLMGLEPGHVTRVPGLSRADQLQCIGNGAVPQQAYAAYAHLLQLIERTRKTMNPDSQAEIEQSEEDWNDVEQSADQVAYPEMPSNPHNHIYTISMDGRGPMIVVRGNTPTEVNERFQALMDGGVTTIAASVYSHLKAEMNVAQGVGPVAPAGPPVQAVQPVPLPQSPQGQYPQPAQQFPGQPGTAPAAWQNVGAPPVTPQSQQQWGAQQGGANGNRGPKPRPTDWPQVYKIDVPFQQKDAFKAYREQYKDHFRGKIAWAGGGAYWIHGDVAQVLAQYNPVPA